MAMVFVIISVDVVVAPVAWLYMVAFGCMTVACARNCSRGCGRDPVVIPWFGSGGCGVVRCVYVVVLAYAVVVFACDYGGCGCYLCL